MSWLIFWDAIVTVLSIGGGYLPTYFVDKKGMNPYIGRMRADLNFAWPSSEIAVMGASGAVAVLCGKEAKAKKEAGEDVKAFPYCPPDQIQRTGYIVC